MFKKSEKQPQPPNPPTLSQIIDDLQTFKEDNYELERVRHLPENSKNPDRDYWRIFQTFLEDNRQMESNLKSLEQMRTNLEDINRDLLQAQNGLSSKLDAEKEKIRELMTNLKSNQRARSTEQL